MSSHFVVLATLALAILFSPETLVLGLVLSSDKKVPREAAYAFAIGAVLGISFATSIGLWIAHASGVVSAPHADHTSWPGFVVRIVIAGALLVIGLYRAMNAIRHKPIPDVTKADHHPGRLRTSLSQHFPKLMHSLDPKTDLPVRQRITRAALAGFAICGLHPKVFPIAIAAGHQILQISDHAERTLGIVVFAVISLVPALAPAVIETVRPGASARIKDAYERIMKEHGRWITAALLLGVGAFLAHEAFMHMPRTR